MHHGGQSAQNGALIHFHEFKGFVEIRRAANHLLIAKSDGEAEYGRQMRRPPT
jgi:hypothetical protein